MRDIHGVEHRNVPIKICGNHAALYLASATRMSGGVPANSERVITVWGDARYAAIYVYPAKAKPDPEAEVAIRSLCKKGSEK